MESLGSELAEEVTTEVISTHETSTEQTESKARMYQAIVRRMEEKTP